MHPEARALKQRYEAMADLFEIPTDVEPFGEERASYLAAVNKQRVSRGLAPLENDEVGHPELTEERRGPDPSPR